MYSSNHISIKLNFIQRQDKSQQNKNQKWNLIPNWELFTNLLEKLNVHNSNNLEGIKLSQIKVFQSKIKPYKKLRTFSIIKISWWTKEIKEVI